MQFFTFIILNAQSALAPSTWTFTQRRLYHSYIASSMTLCPNPRQTFIRRCFSSSTSWTWVSQMFPCMHPCRRRTFLHLVWLKFVWLILPTTSQNGGVSYVRILLFLNIFSQGSVVTRCMCGGKYDMSLVANLLLSPTVKKKLKIGQH